MTSGLIRERRRERTIKYEVPRYVTIRLIIISSLSGSNIPFAVSFHTVPYCEYSAV
jgi:hypothetical protein